MKGTKTLGIRPYVHPTASIEDSSLGKWTEVSKHTLMTESSMGDYSYIMEYCQIIYTTIGKFCSIASFVRLNPSNHPIERPTSHHMTYRASDYGFADTDETSFFDWRREHAVTIGHDVWIGHNATIMPGVTVGNGAVIASGAVVTKDVASYNIVAGVAAKPIRQRFSDDVIEKLETIQWWDWSRETLEKRFLDFRDMDTFLEKYS